MPSQLVQLYQGDHCRDSNIYKQSLQVTFTSSLYMYLALLCMYWVALKSKVHTCSSCYGKRYIIHVFTSCLFACCFSFSLVLFLFLFCFVLFFVFVCCCLFFVVSLIGVAREFSSPGSILVSVPPQCYCSGM